MTEISITKTKQEEYEETVKQCDYCNEYIEDDFDVPFIQLLSEIEGEKVDSWDVCPNCYDGTKPMLPEQRAGLIESSPSLKSVLPFLSKIIVKGISFASILLLLGPGLIIYILGHLYDEINHPELDATSGEVDVLNVLGIALTILYWIKTVPLAWGLLMWIL